MRIIIPEQGTPEEKLLLLSDALELIKAELEEIVDELVDDDLDTDPLEEASEYIDDAIDAINEGIDVLVEEQTEPDEEEND